MTAAASAPCMSRSRRHRVTSTCPCRGRLAGRLTGTDLPNFVPHLAVGEGLTPPAEVLAGHP
jgi:hypothetical protein